METWKLLLITLLSAVVLGCIIGVVSGKHQVKKLRGGYRPLLTAKERVVYALLVVFGAGCIAIGVFVVPTLGAAEGEIIYDEFGNPMPADGMPGEMIDGGVIMEGIPGDIMVNNATPEEAVVDEAVDGVPIGGETTGDEPTEGETTADDAAEGETTSDDVAEGETTSDDVAEGETTGDDAIEGETTADGAAGGETAADEAAEDETEADETEATVAPQHNMPRPPRAAASAAPRRVVRG